MPCAIIRAPCIGKINATDKYGEQVTATKSNAFVRWVSIVSVVGTTLFVSLIAFHIPAHSETHGTFSLKVTKKFEVPLRHSPKNVIWSSDGSRLAVENRLENGVTILDSSGNILERMFRFPYLSYGRVLAFIDGASHLLIHPTNRSDASTALELRDVETGKVMKAIEGIVPKDYRDRDKPNALAISPDQKLAAVNVGAYTVIIYDTTNWHKLHILNPPKGMVFSLCFSPDGTKVVIGHNGGFTIIDPISGHTIQHVHAYNSQYGIVNITSVAVSPDGNSLLAIADVAMINGNVNMADADAWARSLDAIRIWNISDGKPVTSFPPKGAEMPIRQGVWDPKGRYVAFVDANSRLFLWQAMNGGGFTTIDLPSSAESLAASPDGKALAVAHGQGITVFNIE